MFNDVKTLKDSGGLKETMVTPRRKQKTDACHDKVVFTHLSTLTSFLTGLCLPVVTLSYFLFCSGHGCKHDTYCLLFWRTS